MKHYTATGLKKRLKSIFENHPALTLVYFFGSHMARNIGPLSDVDIAIVWKRHSQSYLFEEAAIQRHIRELLKDERFEAGSLNDKPLSFCYNVISNGVCIYGKEEDRVRYETYVLDEYLDFQYYAEQYNKAFREAVLTGRLNW